jgi:hypothetical protein
MGDYVLLVIDVKREIMTVGALSSPWHCTTGCLHLHNEGGETGHISI